MQKRGFTLIELLVVIAVIGLLGTLSVVSFSDSREKARIAKANAHSNQVLRYVGDDLVARWDLDDCGGANPIDTSGLNNSPGLTNASWSTDTPFSRGCSLRFNVASPSSYLTLHLKTIQYFNKFTLTGWIKSTSSGSGTSPYYFDLRIVNSGKLQICLNGCAEGNKKLDDGKWHFVAISGDNNSLYATVDGDSKKEVTRPADTGYIQDMVFGSYGGSSNYIDTVDEVRIYSRALSTREIHQLYADGARKFFASSQ